MRGIAQVKPRHRKQHRRHHRHQQQQETRTPISSRRTSHLNITTRTILRTRVQVRVSARTLAGYGVPSREALLCTRIAPPSTPKKEPSLVSATPNSITVGWVPPKYENGKRRVLPHGER